MQTKNELDIKICHHLGSRDKLMSRTIARKMVFGATLSKYDIFPCKWFGINVYDIFFRHIKQLEIPVIGPRDQLCPALWQKLILQQLQGFSLYSTQLSY